MAHLLGIDLGGTKIEGVIIQNEGSLDVVERLRLPTEKDKGYQHIIRQIGKVVDALEQKTGLSFQKIGIGTPGTTDPSTQLIKNSNTTCLNGMPFLKDLQTSLKREVKMANDANCFALAEAKFGVVKEEAPDAKVIFGVIMGTGVGGGLIVNGEIIGGRHGIGGEWGHNFLDEAGGECYCGKIGCVEQVISGPALERYYHQLSGNQKTFKEIHTLAEAGKDLHARQTLSRLYTMFGKGLSVITNMIDPDVIILGGGLGNIDGLYTEGKFQLKKYIFNSSVDTMILKPKLGDSAGVFGAALLTED